MSYTVLLADDSLTTHRAMELTFAGQDIHVMSVADGEQALQRMRKMRPDILVAEVVLPRVDGYQLAEHVRRTPSLAGMPVLLLTGASDAIDEPRVLACGAAGIIVKPFEPEVVMKRVKNLLGMSRKAGAVTPADRDRSAGVPAAPAVPAAPDAPVAPGAPAPIAPEVAVSSVDVAAAFEALFAAEQGEPLAAGQPDTPEAVTISEELVERIAARVAERLSEGAYLDTITSIVTAVAERVVREEIARIRAKLDQQPR